MEESRTITRKSASNLALAFVLLPREKRDGMSALYAFCREIDDIADDEGIPLEERRHRLAAWRKDIAITCQAAGVSVQDQSARGERPTAEKSQEERAGEKRPSAAPAPSFPTNRELQPVIARHQLKFELFDELIRGVEMDLHIKRYETFEELE